VIIDEISYDVKVEFNYENGTNYYVVGGEDYPFTFLLNISTYSYDYGYYIYNINVNNSESFSKVKIYRIIQRNSLQMLKILPDFIYDTSSTTYCNIPINHEMMYAGAKIVLRYNDNLYVADYYFDSQWGRVTIIGYNLYKLGIIPFFITCGIDHSDDSYIRLYEVSQSTNLYFSDENYSDIQNYCTPYYNETALSLYYLPGNPYDSLVYYLNYNGINGYYTLTNLLNFIINKMELSQTDLESLTSYNNGPIYPFPHNGTT
jgi:hypothetical protein